MKRIFAGDDPSAKPYVLAYPKRIHRIIAKAAHQPILICCTEGLGAIFNENNFMLLAKRRDRSNILQKAKIMCYDENINRCNYFLNFRGFSNDTRIIEHGLTVGMMNCIHNNLTG